MVSPRGGPKELLFFYASIIYSILCIAQVTLETVQVISFGRYIVLRSVGFAHIYLL